MTRLSRCAATVVVMNHSISTTYVCITCRRNIHGGTLPKCPDCGLDMLSIGTMCVPARWMDDSWSLLERRIVRNAKRRGT